MATHTVQAGGIGSPAFPLVANEVSVVTFSETLLSVEVVSDGAAEVWWTCNGDTPAPGAGWYLPGYGVDDRKPPAPGPTVVKLMSTGTVKVRVQRGA